LSWPSSADSDSTVPLAVLLPVKLLLAPLGLVLPALLLSFARAICHAGMAALPCAAPEAPNIRVLWSDVCDVAVCCVVVAEGALYAELGPGPNAGTVLD